MASYKALAVAASFAEKQRVSTLAPGSLKSTLAAISSDSKIPSPAQAA
jgi:hypothetical protein